MTARALARVLAMAALLIVCLPLWAVSRLFGSGALIDGYIFIIYLINKVMGIALLPFIIIMAFCPPEIATISLYVALSFILLLVIYRYIRAYGLIKNYIYFSKLHFFLYLCAFEIAPLLLIYKVLLTFEVSSL